MRATIGSAALILIAHLNLSYAQSTPSANEFKTALVGCAAQQQIKLPISLLESISSLYAGDNSRVILATSQGFLSLIPEADRIEAYRLYANCIVAIAPKAASLSTSPGRSELSQPSINQPPPIVTSYRMCIGEYERACQPHDVYQYCGSDANAWARDKCSSASIRELNSYGGNKCGYSLDEIICTGPK